MNALNKLKDRLASENVQPRWETGRYAGPMCTEDSCPSFDGRRCDKIGGRPHGSCEPAVTAMTKALAALQSP